MARQSRPQQVPDPGILDLVHLRRYTQGNAELEAELLGLFAGQVPDLMNEIRKGPAADGWKLAVHTLKGSARAVGAVAVGDLAARLEKMEPSTPAETWKKLADIVEKEVAAFAREAKKLASDA
jgi:HPt (histidine-containing phosphotransfer) domain-containing protein